jgi:hypothetical protein
MLLRFILTATVFTTALALAMIFTVIIAWGSITSERIIVFGFMMMFILFIIVGEWTALLRKIGKRG